MGEYVHSKQVRFDKSFVSCGVLEAHHLPDQAASKTVFSIMNALYNKANPRPTAFVIFSDTIDNARGRKVAEFFKKVGKFGQLKVFGPTVNPKSGNDIEFWVLHLNHETARKWYQDELANRVDESHSKDE